MNNEFLKEEKERLLCNEIRQFVKHSNYNIFPEAKTNYYEEPLIGFASIDNPLFEMYKEVIGEHHLTPKQVLERNLLDQSDSYGSVVSVVLPISEEVRKSNRSEKEFGSRKWALTRYYGDEIFIDQLIENILSYLSSIGYWGIAPSRSYLFQKMRIGQDLTSNWSERHIAYAAGLGTFSINDGFITEKGIAVKLLSIVTNACFSQSNQEYQDYQENCLWYRSKSCGACMKRCPVGAITENGHDKMKCYMHCYGEKSQEVAKNYGGSSKHGSGCGLCQTGVPCEFRNPMKPGKF